MHIYQNAVPLMYQAAQKSVIFLLTWSVICQKTNTKNTKGYEYKKWVTNTFTSFH